MQKKIVNKEYGQRLYVDGKYASLNKTTESQMTWLYLYKQSEFKKPYMQDSKGKNPSYAEMEQYWPDTSFDDPGYYGPGDFPSTPTPQDPEEDYPYPPDPEYDDPDYYYEWPGCGTVTLDPEKSEMYDEETQNIAINGIQPPFTSAFHYEIILTGYGSIWPTQGSVGDTILYTPEERAEDYTAKFKMLLTSDVPELGAELCANASIYVFDKKLTVSFCKPSATSHLDYPYESSGQYHVLVRVRVKDPFGEIVTDATVTVEVVGTMSGSENGTMYYNNDEEYGDGAGGAWEGGISYDGIGETETVTVTAQKAGFLESVIVEEGIY